ncbi:hypothetical protein DRN82_08335 [Thermococci archaeon]|nr:MAG: hypothetical protein DRN82_08335 [Thermococci archaeon]
MPCSIHCIRERIKCRRRLGETLEEEGVEEVSLYGMSGRIGLVPLAKWLLKEKGLFSMKLKFEINVQVSVSILNSLFPFFSWEKG